MRVVWLYIGVWRMGWYVYVYDIEGEGQEEVSEELIIIWHSTLRRKDLHRLRALVVDFELEGRNPSPAGITGGSHTTNGQPLSFNHKI